MEIKHRREKTNNSNKKVASMLQGVGEMGRHWETRSV